MPRVIEDALVEPVSPVLLGAIDVDGGATEEQQAVLAAIVSGYWGRTDLDLTTLAPLGPDDAAAAIVGGAHRRRVRELWCSSSSAVIRSPRPRRNGSTRTRPR